MLPRLRNDWTFSKLSELFRHSNGFQFPFLETFPTFLNLLPYIETPPQGSRRNQKTTQKNTWLGGKPLLNLARRGSYFHILNNKQTLHKVNSKDFQSLKEAKDAAEHVLHELATYQNLFINQYRISETPESSYIEVDLGPRFMTCDTDSLELAQKHLWKLNELNEVYAMDGKTKKYFATELAGKPPKGHIVHFKDGNPLNLRKSNIQFTKKPTAKVTK